MANPDLTALAAYSGAYEQRLTARLYKDLILAADGIQVIPGVKSTLNLTRLVVSKGIKPFTGKFVPGDEQLIYQPRQLVVKKAQRDIEINPANYLGTYQEAMRAGTENSTNFSIPFAQVVWDTVMKESANEVVDMIYWGKGKDAFAAYNAGNTYNPGDLISFVNTSAQSEVQYYQCIAATSAGQNPLTNPEKWTWAGNLAVNKGYNAIIADTINNEGFNQIVSTGPITSIDAYDQFTAVWRKQREQFKNLGANMYCSYNSYEALMDNLEQVNKFTKETNSITYLPKTNQKALLKPVYWLSGSNRIICTPANNLLLGTDALSDMNTINNVMLHYTLQTSISFVIGTELRDLDALVINEQQ